MTTSTTQFYIHGSTYNQSGESSCHFTQSVESKEKPLWIHDAGLDRTASGYGSRIPTRYMVKFNGRWRRVYCRCYSNNGTLYIGQLRAVGDRLIISGLQIMANTDFKVYKRKIYVWLKTTNGLVFQHATNAYPICKAACDEMKRRNPTLDYVGGFAK